MLSKSTIQKYLEMFMKTQMKSTVPLFRFGLGRLLAREANGGNRIVSGGGADLVREHPVRWVSKKSYNDLTLFRVGVEYLGMDLWKSLIVLGSLSLCACQERGAEVVQENLGATVAQGASAEQKVAAIGKISFNEHVRPILSDTCFHCHGPDEHERKAGYAIHTFDLATRELEESPGKFGIVPGKPEESHALQLVLSEDDSELMPPADSIHKLTEEQKLILKVWVEQGAEYEEHWAFTKPRRQVPEAQLQNPWVVNPIDAFVAAKHQQNGVQPSEPAAPEKWLRRITLGLTGVQPTMAELEAFLNDESQGAKERVVDRLLESQRYGEHMAVNWMEAARYADTDGYQNDHERENWPWRDYVIKAFNANMPFDQFTIEQMAGDMLENPTHEQLIATTFNRNHRQNAEGGALQEEFLVENILDRVETVGQIYFAMTMSCARCHDHKYDPLSQKEVFSFAGYFNNIGEKGIGRGIQSQPVIHSASLFASEDEAKVIAEIHELNNKHIKLRDSVAAKLRKEKKLSKQDSQKQASQDPGVRKAHAELQVLRKKASTYAYPQGARVMVMREKEEITPSYLLERGQYDSPDKSEVLPRTVPAVLLGDEDAPQNRLELAQWMMSENNPITARVLVNRIWEQHFGKGICTTPEDFGSQAHFPSHPKLLDWLAVEFRESGWDVKAMHKLIALSATYNQSSKHRSDLDDPQNVLLARGPRHRVSGYVIRDQALHAAGLLHEKLGGASVKPYQPHGLWNNVSASSNIFYKESAGSALYRRSIYTYWKRAVNPPRQLLFDAAGREICTVTQKRTNTPLQALVLMNDPTFVEAARVLAQRAMSESPEDPLALVYETAVGYQLRDSVRGVLDRTYSYYQDYYGENQAEADELVKVGASPIVADDKKSLAALMMVAHVVMNTDEMVTSE